MERQCLLIQWEKSGGGGVKLTVKNLPNFLEAIDYRHYRYKWYKLKIGVHFEIGAHFEINLGAQKLKMTLWREEH